MGELGNPLATLGVLRRALARRSGVCEEGYASRVPSHLGELAAFATAVCWTGSALFFSAAGKRIGSLATNLIRFPIAIVFLATANLVARGRPLPLDATPANWGWLALSGFIGLVAGDLCLFRAYVVLGPRLTLLVNATAPFFTVLLGWRILGEVLTLRQLGGIAATGAGIAVALAAHRGAARARPAPVEAAAGEGFAHRDGVDHWSLRGVLLALGGALGQAGGLVVGKLGMRGYPPLASTEIRVLTAGVCIALVFTALGLWPRVRLALRHPSGLAFTALGAFCGPTAGVTLALYAIAHAPTGVASSLMALSPLLVLPVVAWRGERVGWGGLVGAGLAVGGVVLLVWR
jgi:drug/metabolite transporter (DMT)-like permease